MADALIKDAQKKLADFAKIWSDRSCEFDNEGMREEARKALSLHDKAKEKITELDADLLEEDERLDESYSKIRKKVEATA